jgi:hypothetical protein
MMIYYQLALPGEVKKPKWARPRKLHGNAAARVYTDAEAAEIVADQAERSSMRAGKEQAGEVTPENSSDRDFMVPGTPRGFVGACG